MAPELEAELDRLFAAPFGDFVAQRDELSRGLRKDGDREAADQVKALRKPSLAVWAVNQLARKEPKDFRALLDAGARLREAQENVLAGESPEKLEGAAAAERELVDKLTEKARQLLESAGHPVTESTARRVSATLHAVATKPELREPGERGRLVHEEEVAGFGFELLNAVPARSPDASAKQSGRTRARKDAARARLKEAREELADATKEEKRASAEVERLRREIKRASAEAERKAEEVERRERAVEQARSKLEELD